MPSADECLDLGGAAPETDFAPPPRDPLILTVPLPAPATHQNLTETHFRDTTTLKITLPKILTHVNLPLSKILKIHPFIVKAKKNCSIMDCKK